jgi:hypothetical protein
VRASVGEVLAHRVIPSFGLGALGPAAKPTPYVGQIVAGDLHGHHPPAGPSSTHSIMANRGRSNRIEVASSQLVAFDW